MPADREYIPGTFYRIDDRTGFKVRDYNTRRQWNNIYTRPESWEDRPAQDFVRGVFDEQKVPLPRPRQVDVFVGPLQTETTAPAAAGGTVIHVFTELRFDIGDRLTIMMLSGENHTAFVQDASVSGQLRIFPPLPYGVGSGAPVTNYSAVAGVSIG